MNHSTPDEGFRFWLWLIRFVGVIVPRSLREDWRMEWEAELSHREALLAEWDRLDRWSRVDLLRRSTSAFRDALLLQPKRLEDEMFQDLRFGIRMLTRQPGFTLIAVLTLALGIGANTAIFSTVNALVLRPLPYPEPERLVWIEELSKKDNSTRVAWGGHFLHWEENSKTVETIAQVEGSTRTLTGAGEPERIEVGTATSGFLPMLGFQALPLGRNFAREEDRPDAARVAIVSHQLWARRFSSDREIIGKGITLNDASYTVIGVLPQSFNSFYQFDVWVPLALNAQQELLGERRSYQSTIARLKPGVTFEQASRELDDLARRYEGMRPSGPMENSAAQLTSLQTHLVGESRRPLLVLLGAVSLILLIACSNVVNLLLARAITRQKELAIRAALGASRFRLTRQMLTECLLLAGAGGACGLLLAYWLTKFLGTLNAIGGNANLLRVSPVTIDASVLAFTVLISLSAGLLCGFVSALQRSQRDLSGSLKEGERGSAADGSRLRNALLVSEIALAVVLLVGAGLLIRSFVKLLRVDPGYRAENLLSTRFALPPRYSDKASRVRVYESVLQRMGAIPGVEAASLTSHLPLTSYNLGGQIRVEGREYQPHERPPSAPFTSIDPTYFQTMGMRLLEGRPFTDADSAGAPPVAIVSQRLGRELFGNESPIGKRVMFADIGGATTIVGVVDEVRQLNLERPPDTAIYFNYRQWSRPSVGLVLRTSVPSLNLVPEVRRAMLDVDSALPLSNFMTMEERLSRSVASRRANLILLGAFATLALILSGVGVYGVVAYVVTQRTREIGIRKALGAQNSEVLRLVVKQGMSLVLIGLAIGLCLAVASTRAMNSLLFETGSSDPVTLVAVSLFLPLIAWLACYVPARRAARIDPLVALRHQ